VCSSDLTNDPALDGLDELTAQAAASYLHFPNEDEKMDEELIALLGLDKTADDAAIITAVTALKSQADQVEGLTTEVAALTTQIETTSNPDPTKFAPVAVVEDLKKQVAALASDQLNREVTELVDAGLADGRLLPAQKEWATELGKTNQAALTSYLATATPVAALGGKQSAGKNPDDQGNETQLTENQLATCTSMGIDPEDYAKTLAAA
jgi:phage I-like protein